jgi:murein DD-endopeptidase MepM/ murein hydrolase activator NlpD
MRFSFYIVSVLRKSLILVLVAMFVASPVTAMTAEDFSSIRNNTAQYIPEDSCTSPAGAGGQPASPGAGGAATSGTWNSGLQPPYILEQFAIEVIKNVATKMNQPNPEDFVTEEHVVALIAFMVGEGGDINNRNLYNPLNTGINAPELLASGNNGSGHQWFKSFDAGVEATARTMVGTKQSRLATTILDKTSTAEQFMKALTYYKDYPGNMYWAALSDPSYNGNDGVPALGPNAPQIYYDQRIALVNRVRKNYSGTAGLIIGTTAREEKEKLTATEKLKFHPTSDTGTTPNNSKPATASPESCGASPGQSSGSVVVDNMTFPLQGGKRVVRSKEMFKNGTTEQGGHPYIAYDIMSPGGTVVVAMVSGRVVQLSKDVCNGRLVAIYNEERKQTFSYLHLQPSSVSLNVGDELKVGDRIGEVGRGLPNCNGDHLHIDAVDVTRRVGCSRRSCPPQNKVHFRDIGPELFKLYEALPE